MTDLLAELEAQEARLRFSRFDNETALALGLQLLEAARAARPGTSADNDAWVERKSRVVDRYGHSSYLVGEQFRAGGSTFEAKSRLDPDLFAAHGGVFPVIVEGVGPVGTVGVSGLPQADDHAFVVAQLERFLGR